MVTIMVFADIFGDPKGFCQNLSKDIVISKLKIMVFADIFGNP